MKVGHIYKKGKSYYLCESMQAQLGDLYYILIKFKKTYPMFNMPFILVFKNDIVKYTHIGKAIDLIRGIEG